MIKWSKQLEPRGRPGDTAGASGKQQEMGPRWPAAADEEKRGFQKEIKMVIALASQN